MKNKTIYVPLAVDILHSAHINILKKAKKYGKVIVGLLTDSAIAEYKKFPLINYKERYNTLEGIKYIDQIVEQKNWDYTENIKKYKPNFFIHGDDWKTGIQKKQRRKVINILKEIKGKLIEVPFNKNISSTEIKHKIIAASLFIFFSVIFYGRQFSIRGTNKNGCFCRRMFLVHGGGL